MLKTKNYNLVLLIVILLCFFRIAMPSAFKMDETKSPLFLSFPLQLGDWKGEESPLDERTYEILETRNILSRRYKNTKGQEVFLLLVGSRKDRRVAHPPEVCYLSSNYIIVNESEGQVSAAGRQLTVKTFTAKNERHPNIQTEVLYLYKVGERFTTNYYAQQLRFALDKMARKDSAVLLIRLDGHDKTVFPDFLSQVLKSLQDSAAEKI